MGDNLPELPTELLVIIFVLTAQDHRQTAAGLCLVSKWVRDLIEPILYRVRALKQISKAKATSILSSAPLRRHLQYLGLVNGSFITIRLDDVQQPPLLNVRNLAIDAPFYDDLVDPSHIEELHLLSRRPPGWVFPQLKRFHYCRRTVITLLQTANAFPVAEILKHPHLTHIALSVEEELRMSDLFSAVSRLLKEHKPLELLLVRLLSSHSIVLHGIVDNESLEARLASVGDSRLVVKRCNVQANPVALLDEWEKNALRGENVWDSAQGQLEARKWGGRFY